MTLPVTVTVAIPVYGGATFVETCLQSVLRHTPKAAKIIVIDDASPDADTVTLLDRMARETRIELVRHAENRGFVGSVNHAFERAAPADIVVLNSDTRVTEGWLQGLIDCAYAMPEVGTCSPLTNAGSIFAVPEPGVTNALPPGWTDGDVARTLRRLSTRARPQVPTTHGFCMYVKRALLDDVGGFDEAAFGRGYGEENDLCLRASERGWIHLVDDQTFVFHRGSGTFGAQKERLMARARAILEERYPYYRKLVRMWIERDPLRETRARMAAAFSRPPRPPARRHRLLIVYHDGKGGVLHTTSDLIAHLRETHEVWELKSKREYLTLIRHHDGGHTEQRTLSPLLPPQLTDVTHKEYAEIFDAVLDEVRPDVVHVRHLLAHTHDPVRRAKARGIPVVMSVHDFYLVCPVFTLIDNRGEYCAGKCNSDEQDCVPNSMWIPLAPRLKRAYLPRWRAHVEATLSQVDALITTSAFPRDMLRAFYPSIREIPFHVIEHGRDLAGYRPSEPKGAGPLKVITFGAMGVHKGLDALVRLSEQLPPDRVQLHVLGSLPAKTAGRFVRHGPYDRDALPELVEGIAPSVALLPSIMPETYCHALTEAWAMGLPVIGADRGALGERIRQENGGWVVTPEDVEGMKDLLLRLADRPDEIARVRRRVQSIRFPTAAEMARAYVSVYDGVAGEPTDTEPSPARVVAEAELRGYGRELEPRLANEEAERQRLADELDDLRSRRGYQALERARRLYRRVRSTVARRSK